MKHDKNNNDCLCNNCIERLFSLARDFQSDHAGKCANCGKITTVVNGFCKDCLNSTSTVKPSDIFYEKVEEENHDPHF